MLLRFKKQTSKQTNSSAEQLVTSSTGLEIYLGQNDSILCGIQNVGNLINHQFTCWNVSRIFICLFWCQITLFENGTKERI